MKYERLIRKNVSAVKSYLSLLIEKKYDFFADENTITGEIKNNRVYMYVTTYNRFPSGFIFRGKLIEKDDFTILKGNFIVPPIRIVFYLWCFGISYISYNSASIYTLIPLAIVLVILIFDIIISNRQKVRLRNFLDEVSERILQY